MNRHGDGRPSNARWYQSTSSGPRRAARRVTACGAARALDVARSIGTRPPGAATSSARRPVHRTSVRRRRAWRRRAGGRAGAGRSRRALPTSGAQPAAEPVADDGAADGAADGEGDRRRGDRGIAEVPTPQGLGPWRGGHGAAVARTLGARGSARSSRQARAALEPPGLDDRAAGPRAHPGAEAVLAGSAAGVRLVGALHVKLRTRSNGAAARQADPPRLRDGHARDGNVPRVPASHRQRRAVAIDGLTTDPPVRTRGAAVVPSEPRPECAVHSVWTMVWIGLRREGRRCR